MKTLELIEELYKADPSGQLEVTVGKTPIHFVEQLPAYYDGCLQKLVQDKTNPYYNIIGGVITSKGSHVKIHTLSIEDAILDNPDLPVTIDMGSFCQPEERAKLYQGKVDEWREDSRRIAKEVEEHMKNKDS